MKFFNFCLLIFCLFNAQLVAQDDVSEENPFDFMSASDSVKVMKRFRVQEPVSLLGINTYLSEDGGFDLPGEYSNLEQRLGRSIQWGIGLIDGRLGLHGKDKVQKLGLMAGLRWNLSYYRFENDFQLVEGADTFQDAVKDVDKEIKKHRLLANYISIPIMLDFYSNPLKTMKSMRISVGYVHSFLLLANYKLKYEDKEKVKVKDDFNLNRSIGMLEARIGYGPVAFYVQYGLDGLFAEDKGPNVTPFNFGLVSGGL